MGAVQCLCKCKRQCCLCGYDGCACLHVVQYGVRRCQLVVMHDGVDVNTAHDDLMCVMSACPSTTTAGWCACRCYVMSSDVSTALCMYVMLSGVRGTVCHAEYGARHARVLLVRVG